MRGKLQLANRAKATRLGVTQPYEELLLGPFLSNLFGNIKAWLQAVGVGAAVALQQYLATVSTSDPDPLAAIAKGLLLALLVKAVGALIRTVPA